VRLISFSEYEAGVLAIWGSPFGIIAIGGFPVGVIAIGIVPVGVFSFACGAGLGVVNYTCGLGFGGYVRAVGAAIGGDASAVGLNLGIAGERPTPEQAVELTAGPDEVLASDRELWVETRTNPEGELWGLRVRVEMMEEARTKARKLRNKAVFAKLRAVHPAPPAQHGYREAAETPDPYFVCSDVADATPKTPLGPFAWYALRVALVAAVVLGVLGYVTRGRLELTKMTRVVEAAWRARPAEVQGAHISKGAGCRIDTELRSDGERQLHADVLVHCGSRQLFNRQVRSGCSVEQIADDAGHRYKLKCSAARIAESEDSDGNVSPERPGLELDTIAEPAHARVWEEGPPKMNVRLEVDALSEPVKGEPLLPEGRTKLDAQ